MTQRLEKLSTDTVIEIRNKIFTKRMELKGDEEKLHKDEQEEEEEDKEGENKEEDIEEVVFIREGDKEKPPEPLEGKTKEGADGEKICNFCIRGHCRHGFLGRRATKEGPRCKFKHSQACKAWMKNGSRTTAPLRCNLGPECKYAHPKICKESLMFRTCSHSDEN